MGNNEEMFDLKRIEGDDSKFHDLRYRLNRTEGNFVFLKHYFCKIRNCTPIYKIFPKESHIYYFMRVYDKIRFPNVTFGFCRRLRFLVAVIPHLSRIDAKPQCNYPKFLAFYAFFLIILIFIKAFVKYFRFHQCDRPTMTIFSCILGLSVNVGTNPKR